MREGWTDAAIGDLVTQERRRVGTCQGEEYHLLGVRWYGKGPFLRETVTANSSKASHFFQVRSGDFIYNRLFAWKGSFGVVGDDLDGCYVSGEFPVFTTNRELLLADYLFLVMARPEAWAQIERESTGSTTTSRNRWKEVRFLEWRIDLPPLAEQRRIVDLIESADAYIECLEQQVETLTTVRGSMTAEFFDSADRRWRSVQVRDVCEIAAPMVDPREDAFGDLPHLAIERIESRTGRFRDLRSAREDGVISGKYRFGPEDVVYSKIRPELRKVCYPKMEGLCSADAYPLRCVGAITPEFLLLLLLSENFSVQAVARSARTKMPKVNRAELFSIEVAIPPLDEQERITGEVAAVDCTISAAERAMAKARAVRSTLLSDLLTGNHEIPQSYDKCLGAA